jgi:diguanylate cyclase (GGDEF)-like protein
MKETDMPDIGAVSCNTEARGLRGILRAIRRLFRGTAERVRELEAANERLREEIAERTRTGLHMWHIAHHDALTGLANRILFNERLEQAVSLARRHGIGPALMFIDLDGFKRINDTLGHRVGDEFLRVAAQRLVHTVRTTDFVARLGGDEFVILMHDAGQKECALTVAQKVRAALTMPVTIDGREVRGGASIGLSLFPEDGDDGETLLRHADLAMYEAKGARNNAIRFYGETALATTDGEKNGNESALRQAR